ncbi:hypothetical protein K450DRAFT_300467 [Umbelopsis ramanniana AG]|uniref:Uncharacterized protein n=1 Tax=Umbelopsis ramanniana AG TaxID=1314678 RepID=A0AAD5E8A8_UMBRA|nr:uncharacterized protein K450DRAFT_300467 [Umbelopsis ramanniana AG]KAI8579156.1 hypothetical protein K450DRAFT_300467 [Umbelopsis ramanniana AG]
MRVCLTAIAALLLTQIVLGQDVVQDDVAATTSVEVAPEGTAAPEATAVPEEGDAPAAVEKSNAEFQLLADFDATPIETALELEQEFQILSWTSANPISTKSFVFELEAPAHLLLTDFKQNGDSFMVYDNGEVIGATRPAVTTEAYAETPEDAVADASFSKAAFPLAPGAHNITIEATSPFEFGSAAVRLVANEQSLYKEDDDDEKDEHHKNHKDTHRKGQGLTATAYVEVSSIVTKWVTLFAPVPTPMVVPSSLPSGNTGPSFTFVATVTAPSAASTEASSTEASSSAPPAVNTVVI